MQQRLYESDLFAPENCAQLLTVKPGSGSTLGGVLTDKRLKVGELGQIQFVCVFEQRPTHAFELRVELLLLPAYSVERLGRVSENVKLVEGQPGVGQMFIAALDKGRRHIDADRADLLGRASVFAQTDRKAFKRAAILARRDEHDSPRLHIGDKRQILMTTPVKDFVNCYRRHARQVKPPRVPALHTASRWRALDVKTG